MSPELQSYDEMADTLYRAVFSGAIGAATLALTFLALDSAMGRPLWAPSLVGSVIFLGSAPAEVTTVRLDMVALFSLLHLTGFVTLGAAFSLLLRRFPELDQRIPLTAGCLFASMNVAVGLAGLALPGLISAMGLGTIMAANAAASGAMAWFYATTTAEETWIAAPIQQRS